MQHHYPRALARRHAVASIALAVVLSACSDSTPTTPGAALGRQSVAQQRQGPSRTDTPWRGMTDAELSAKIAEANGKVFIGFKDLGATAGVDEAGRVLASASSVVAGKSQVRALGIEITYEFIDMPMVLGQMPSALLSQLRGNPLIEYVEPILPGDYLAQTTTWNVQRVRAPEAWSSSTGSGAKLLIIDSGIDNAHPDLAAAVIQSCDGSNGLDEIGHGTAVAGIAAALNNTIQIVGVAHGVSLWSSRVGRFAPDAGAAACAVEFGRINNVHAMNMSLSLSSHTGLTDQINAANSAGIVLVAAAGNTGGGAVTYPATLDAVIAVSATDTNNAFASFSSQGSKVEITAPGTTVTGTRGLTSTCLGGTSTPTCGFGRVEGTSFAAPHVAAAAALLKAYNSSWSNTEIRRRLGAGATDLGAAGRDAQFGHGLLNIPGAIAADPPPPPPLSGVTIDGPTMVPSDFAADFTASPSGGTSPFTYTWRVDGVVQQQGSSNTFTWSAASSYTLNVTVQDALQATATASINVTVCPGLEIQC